MIWIEPANGSFKIEKEEKISYKSFQRSGKNSERRLNDGTTYGRFREQNEMAKKN